VIPTDFVQSNKLLGPPAGREETVAALPVYCDGQNVVSRWMLTDAEVERIVRDRAIWINVLGGATQPPIYPWVGELREGIA
jgi:hypothetical protein